MQLDSTKIKLQLENLDYENSLYSEQTRKTPDRSEQTKFTLYQRPLGLKHIEILPTTNEVLIEFSAKILQEQYLQGINKNTVERLHHQIKPYIKFSLDDLLNAIVLRTDIAENLIFDSQQDKENALKSLILGKSNTGFKVDDFVAKKAESIIFTGRQVSYKNRQIYYNKEKELFMARNKEIMKFIKSQYSEISKILRVEQNVSSFDKLRQAIGKKPANQKLVSNFDNPNSVRLNEMLLSTNKPLYERHKIIMKYANEVSIFDEYDDISVAEKLEGYRGIYRKCNSSIELMLDFYKEKSPNYKFFMRRKKEILHFSNNIVQFRTKMSHNNSYFESLKTLEKMLEVA